MDKPRLGSITMGIIIPELIPPVGIAEELKQLRRYGGAAEGSDLGLFRQKLKFWVLNKMLQLLTKRSSRPSDFRFSLYTTEKCKNNPGQASSSPALVDKMMLLSFTPQILSCARKKHHVRKLLAAQHPLPLFKSPHP